MVMLDNKLCLTCVVEFLRSGRVDRGTREGKVVVVVDLSKRKVIHMCQHGSQAQVLSHKLGHLVYS